MLYMYFITKNKIEERGAGMAEYALLLALVAVLLVGAFTGLKDAIVGTLGDVVAEL